MYVKVSIERIGSDEKAVIKRFFCEDDCEDDEIPGEVFEKFVRWCSRNGLVADEYTFDILEIERDYDHPVA